MTYEMYRYVFLGGGIAAGVMFAVTLILFFALRIPKIVSDLTGRSARRAIEDIRKQNEETGNKVHRSSAVNRERGKITAKMSNSGKELSVADSPFVTGTITEKISTARMPAAQPGEETTVLNGDYMATFEETVPVEQWNGCDDSGETTILSTQETGETTILNQPDDARPEFAVVYEITYVHSDEIIGGVI